MGQQMTEVEFGSHKVAVPKGGFYDRFHRKPDLDEVAKDPAAGNVDFFRRIPKRLASSKVGPTWAPNFYYRAKSLQFLFLAPLNRVRTMLPSPLEPLRPIPGHGLVALNFFSYTVCDNDPYNEVSVAALIRRPGSQGTDIGEMFSSMRRRNYFAHVLALPVNTEIARVRGVYAYQLPKWRTEIEISTEQDITARTAGKDGKDDLNLRMPLPKLQTPVPQSHMVTTNMIHLLDGEWNQTVVQTNVLSYSQQAFPRGIHLERCGGPLSQLLDGLGAGSIVRADVVMDSQIVLNLPTPCRSL